MIGLQTTASCLPFGTARNSYWAFEAPSRIVYGIIYTDVFLADHLLT